MMLAFLIPIALITLFALAFGSVFHKKGEAKPTVLIVADDDKTIASKNTIMQLDSLKEFQVKQTSSVDAENLVKKGDEVYVILK